MLPRILNNNNGNLAVLALLSCLLPSPASGLLNPEDYTPNATLVDFDSPGPSEAYASLSVPEGTPWCNGAPTFWMVGHQVRVYIRASRGERTRDIIACRVGRFGSLSATTNFRVVYFIRVLPYTSSMRLKSRFVSSLTGRGRRLRRLRWTRRMPNQERAAGRRSIGTAVRLSMSTTMA